MFPVNPSQTTTSATLARRSRPSTLPMKRRPLASSGGPGLAHQAVTLLRLLADGQEGDLGIPDADDLVGEHGTHVRELDEVLGPGVGVRTRVDEDGGAADGRKRNRDRRPVHVGEPADLEQARSQRRAGVSC